MAVTYDITVTLCVAFVSYFGSKSHKPRWIGIGCIIIGVGCIVFALPEFVFGEYEVGDASKGSRYPVCLEDDYEPDCSGSNTGAYALFILGNVLIGIGASPIYLLGITFVDEISHPKRTPIYLALVFLASVVGPSLGYGLGGVFLSIYVDPWVETDLDETDPGWVGAWWIAFVMMGILSLLLSIPFLMFPRQLPNHKIIEKARSEEMANKRRYDPTSRSTVKSSLKTFLIQIKNLFINPSFVFHTLYIAMASFAGFGLLAFFPHYIESQFHLKASTASLLAGAVAIVCSGKAIRIITKSIIRAFINSLVLHSSGHPCWRVYCGLRKGKTQRKSLCHHYSNCWDSPAAVWTRLPAWLPSTRCLWGNCSRIPKHVSASLLT